MKPDRSLSVFIFFCFYSKLYSAYSSRACTLVWCMRAAGGTRSNIGWVHTAVCGWICVFAQAQKPKHATETPTPLCSLRIPCLPRHEMRSEYKTQRKVCVRVNCCERCGRQALQRSQQFDWGCSSTNRARTIASTLMLLQLL